MDLPLWVWFAFIGAVLGMLALDLGVFHRKAHLFAREGVCVPVFGPALRQL